MSRSLKVAVIGAGYSGLSAARELRQEGHIVIIFEKNDRIGGIWVYDPRTESDPLGVDPNREIVHSSLYLSMRTNLPRQLMGFLDYPFAKRENGDNRTFPGHDEVRRFLEKFAQDFGLHKLIRFSTEVVRVEVMKEKNEWMVESKNRGSEMVTREAFEAVVVCTGHYTEPKLAEIPGIEKWPGLQMHSHNYRIPQPFQGQVVVLIGFGSSSHELSMEIATLAREVHIAIRRTDPVFANLKLENQGNIHCHSMIKYVYEDGLVTFEDGSSVYANTIIHCTGYRYNFPFLETNGIVSIEDNRVGPLYKHVFSPALAPSLSFIGLASKAPRVVVELQSKWVAKVLSGKILLPKEEEMMKSIEEFYQQMEENGLSKHHTHCLSPYQVDYKDWLVEQIGLPPLEEWMEDMLMEAFKALILVPHSYRDHWDDAYWNSFIQSSHAS